MTKATDFLGQEIKPNHLAVYPVRQGSNMWLNKITVTRIEDGGEDGEFVLYGLNAAARNVRLTNLKNLVVINHANV